MTQAHADSWPERPIRLVVQFPPSGTTDIIARLLGEQLSKELDTQIIVENRPGAGGTIATNAVAKARPDGYTYLFTAFSMGTFPSLFKDLPFDVEKDFTPVSLVATSNFVMVVHPTRPLNSVDELLTFARSNPGKVDYAASAPGGVQHLAWALLKQATDTDMLYVPYSGTGTQMTDLLSGRLTAGIDNVAVLSQYIERGELRPLAVTGTSRSPLLPEVPTLAEATGNSEIAVDGWYGIFGPAGVPDEVVEKMHKAVAAALANPELKQRLADIGVEARGNSPAQLAEFFSKELRTWSSVIAKAGVTINN